MILIFAGKERLRFRGIIFVWWVLLEFVFELTIWIQIRFWDSFLENTWCIWIFRKFHQKYTWSIECKPLQTLFSTIFTIFGLPGHPHIHQQTGSSVSAWKLLFGYVKRAFSPQTTTEICPFLLLVAQAKIQQKLNRKVHEKNKNKVWHKKVWENSNKLQQQAKLAPEQQKANLELKARILLFAI